MEKEILNIFTICEKDLEKARLLSNSIPIDKFDLEHLINLQKSSFIDVCTLSREIAFKIPVKNLNRKVLDVLKKSNDPKVKSLSSALLLKLLAVKENYTSIRL